MKLEGSILKIKDISEEEVAEMYSLMAEFYDNVAKDTFLQDLAEKDYCILIRDEGEKIRGFSTQKILKLDNEGEKIHGVFSGDTIIHKKYWGDLSLFKTFANFFFPYGERFENFYWFLIVKGYKTYKILPTFFKTFYPNAEKETPEEIRKIIDFFWKTEYPGEYNRSTGVIEYSKIKDSLKKGVADITEKELRDRHINFFLKMNPHYEKGNDLICIASLKKEFLKDKVKKILFGHESGK